MAVNNHPEENEWTTRMPGYRSELYVYKHTAYPACIDINRAFNMIFSLNARFKLISKTACICLRDVIIPWRIPGIIFHPVNGDGAEKKKNVSLCFFGASQNLPQELPSTESGTNGLVMCLFEKDRPTPFYPLAWQGPRPWHWFLLEIVDFLRPSFCRAPLHFFSHFSVHFISWGVDFDEKQLMCKLKTWKQICRITCNKEKTLNSCSNALCRRRLSGFSMTSPNGIKHGQYPLNWNDNYESANWK